MAAEVNTVLLRDLAFIVAGVAVACSSDSAEDPEEGVALSDASSEERYATGGSGARGTGATSGGGDASTGAVADLDAAPSPMDAGHDALASVPWIGVVPPEHCVPPCIYDLLVECEYPGLQVAPPDPRTCRFDEGDPDRICDYERGYSIEFGAIDLNGAPCARRTASYQELSFGWTDGAGRGVARVVLGPATTVPGYAPSEASCYEDGAEVWYEIEPTDPRCEPWLDLMGMAPNQIPASIVPPNDCPVGECPVP